DPRWGRNKALTLAALSGFACQGAAALQAVSLDLSNACRALASWSLRVVRRRDDEHGHSMAAMPPRLAEHLWPRSGGSETVRRRGSLGNGRINSNTNHNTSGSNRDRPARRWITRVKVESIGRCRGGVTLASWPATMVRLEFGDRFNSPVEGISLPEGLEVVKFGARFNQPVSRTRWPASLRELSFGNDFNQPVSGIDFPPGVRRLDFGGRFNFVVSAVDLPEELRELRFGHGFNREIASVRWPPKLSKLEFCGELQQKVEDVAWPGSLTHLALLGDFDQPVHAVHWPAGLVTISFGDRFQQPLAGITSWPPRLETIVLGRGYRKSLCGCVVLPGPEGDSAGGLQLQVRKNGGGGGSGSSAGAADGGGAGDKHPPLVEALLRVVVVSGERDEHVGDDGCVDADGASFGDASAMAVHAEERALRAGGWDQHRFAAEGGGAAEDEGLISGGVSTDVDVDHEQFSEDEDEDAEGGGQGLPYVDVFGFEDVSWDWEMEDTCLSPPGAY
ncbi:unnamed protein product, partial [Hapterophycus canaliculatus]